MIFKSFNLSKHCLSDVRRILADQEPKEGYTFGTATDRFAWKAATALRGIMDVESSKVTNRPSASQRKRLLDRYQKSLEIVAGIIEDGRDGELLEADPYSTVWAEIESAMQQANLAQIPDIPSLQKAAANVAYAVSQIKREGHPGSMKGLSGREHAIEQALDAWHECFDGEVTTAETSPVVRALHVIETDIRSADSGIGATREAVRNVVGKRSQSKADIPPANPTETHDLSERNRKLREAYAMLECADRDFRFRTALADLDTRRKAGLIDQSTLGKMEDWERTIVDALDHGRRPMVYELSNILTG